MPSQRLVGAGRQITDPQHLPLIGRGEELAFCTAVLTSREASGVVVTGAAGVGKTRLATEVVRAAEDAGYASVRVTATEAGRAVPLGPFAHVLPAEADTAATLLQLLRLARAAITDGSDGRPVVLLVDDGHLLDAASATLVQQLAASAGAAVVVTVRAGEQVPDAIVALWKDHGCEYVELQPLSLEETGFLVESLVGGAADGKTKHRLWEASRGLPLIVRELVLDGLERRLFRARDDLWRWSGPLQPGGRLLELIGARIGQLNDREQALLEIVVLGEPLGWSLLRRGEAAAADSLTRRGVLAAEGDGRRLMLRLAHPLFGESVRARMSPARATGLQRRLADALEATGMKRSGDLLRYAGWRLESGGTASAEVLLRAAFAAERAFDSVLSERLARAAGEAGGGFPAELATARALIGQERFVEAEAILLELAAEARSDEERAWVALARARTLLTGLGRGAEAEDAVVEAMRLVADAALRRELELVRCWVLQSSGRSAEAAEAASLLAADVGADHEFLLRAAGLAAHALVWAGRAEDALALLAKWEPSVQELDARRAPLLPAQYRAARAIGLLYAGRLEESESAAREAYDHSVGDRTTEVTALMALGCGLVALFRGYLRPAWLWSREASELLREEDPVGALPLALALAAQALGQSGDTVGATKAAMAADEARRPGSSLADPMVLLGRAWAAAAEGAFTEARRAALTASDLAEERGTLTLGFKTAHDLVRLGDAEAGAPRLSRLTGSVQGPLIDACAEHAQAMLTQDPRRLETAASALTKLGALLWAAEAESAAASAYRGAGREASARAAAARAALLLEHCGGARTPALTAAGPVEQLSPREREIAGLAAAGAANHEIASRLVVSVRTVENHLQRAYRKLGVTSRRELPSLLGPRE